jgi:hypothetical protein
MYRENVAPTPTPPVDVTRQAVKSCAQIQIGIAVTNVIGLTLATVQLFFFRPPPALQIPLETVKEWRSTAFAVGLTYVLVIGAWAAVNAWALGKRSKPARWSSLGFAFASITSCYAWPFGAFLLYTLLRRDVKAYFD